MKDWDVPPQYSQEGSKILSMKELTRFAAGKKRNCILITLFMTLMIAIALLLGVVIIRGGGTIPGLLFIVGAIVVLGIAIWKMWKDWGKTAHLLDMVERGRYSLQACLLSHAQRELSSTREDSMEIRRTLLFSQHLKKYWEVPVNARDYRKAREGRPYYLLTVEDIPLDFFPADDTLLTEEMKERLSYGETGEKPEKRRETETQTDTGPQKDSAPITAAPENGKNMQREKLTLPERTQETTVPGEIVDKIPGPSLSAANPELLRKALTSARRWNWCASVCGALTTLTLLVLLSTVGTVKLRTWGMGFTIAGFVELFLSGIARKWAMINSEAELRVARFLNPGGEEVSQITEEIGKWNKRSGVLYVLGFLAMAYVLNRLGGG